MKPVDYTLLAGILLWVAAAVFSLRRQKKKGCCGCCEGCNRCCKK